MSEHKNKRRFCGSAFLPRVLEGTAPEIPLKKSKA